ncbi:MAG: RNA 2',3'-cyclic phosphodiesterase [Draconibacterium sp.]|jgi:2'-5' RNA ligase
MENLIRTFIAIKITPEQKLLELSAKIKKELQHEAIKWVEMNNLHLTLRFLGDSTPEQVAGISKILEELATNFRPFQFDLKEIGYFKTKGNPRILFVKLENNFELKLIAKSLEEMMVQMGFDREKKEFKPHLTLARINYLKNKNEFYSVVSQASKDEIQSVLVSEIVFYQSILNSTGPVYKPLKIVKLKM